MDALKFVFRGVPLLLVLYIIIEFVYYGSFPFFAVFATEFLGLEDDWWKIFMVSQA
nr:hypothetical protein [Candidatus Bathyarchaeota archaeon]